MTSTTSTTSSSSFNAPSVIVDSDQEGGGFARISFSVPLQAISPKLLPPSGATAKTAEAAAAAAAAATCGDKNEAGDRVDDDEDDDANSSQAHKAVSNSFASTTR